MKMSLHLFLITTLMKDLKIFLALTTSGLNAWMGLVLGRFQLQLRYVFRMLLTRGTLSSSHPSDWELTWFQMILQLTTFPHCDMKALWTESTSLYSSASFSSLLISLFLNHSIAPPR